MDPTAYQLRDVNIAELAQLVNAQAGQRELKESSRGAASQDFDGSSGAIRAGHEPDAGGPSQVALARRRAEQYGELREERGTRPLDLGAPRRRRQRARGPDSAAAAAPRSGALASEGQAVSSERQIGQKLGATLKGEFAQVAQSASSWDFAKWLLDDHDAVALHCYVVNLSLRPGGFVAGLPNRSGDDAGRGRRPGDRLLRPEERAAKVEPGNEVEVSLKTMPGKIHQGDKVRLGGLGHRPGAAATERNHPRVRHAGRCLAGSYAGYRSSTSPSATGSSSSLQAPQATPRLHRPPARGAHIRR